MFRARSAPGTSTPFPNGAEGNPDNEGNLTVDQALLGQLPRPVYRCLRMHENIVSRTTDIFG